MVKAIILLSLYGDNNLTSQIQNPKVTRAKLDELEISTELLAQVFQSILGEETKIRFSSPGISMVPFILHEDVLTISPVSQANPSIGQVVAFIHPSKHNLLVHRVIDKKTSAILIKGDNSPRVVDGWIEKSQVIGIVTQIERDTKIIRFGLGFERLIIAFLSKFNLLTIITRRLGSMKKGTVKKRFPLKNGESK